MAHPTGESESDAPRLNFDRRLKLEFHGSSVTSDAGLLPFRELDDVLGLMVIAGQNLADGRTGRNGRHDLIGMLRQSVFGRLAGYEDVNDAARLGRDPASRCTRSVVRANITRHPFSTRASPSAADRWLLPPPGGPKRRMLAPFANQSSPDASAIT